MKVELLSITRNCDKLIEQAGRTCYQSEDKITDTSSEAFIARIIKSGHESVLEHASATFRISGVSRALTHQLVRHRLCSFSQQSQRYVNESDFAYVIPPSIAEENEQEYKDDMATIQAMYNRWRRRVKKEDARYVLPNACCSEIVVSANFRQWRHFLKLRWSKHAQWEIYGLAQEILGQLWVHSKAFDDFYYEDE
jgi:thymidylate synthase (FAD)